MRLASLFFGFLLLFLLSVSCNRGGGCGEFNGDRIESRLLGLEVDKIYVGSEIYEKDDTIKSQFINIFFNASFEAITQNTAGFISSCYATPPCDGPDYYAEMDSVLVHINGVRSYDVFNFWQLSDSIYSGRFYLRYIRSQPSLNYEHNISGLDSVNFQFTFFPTLGDSIKVETGDLIFNIQ